MNKEDIIKIILTEGEEGVSTNEKYVDIFDKIVERNMELAQLVYFKNENKLMGYFLDEKYNGYWIFYDKISKENREKIENLDIWKKNDT